MTAKSLALGPLEYLTHDASLTDVAVTCDGRVWADYGDGMVQEQPSIPFRSSAVIREYAVQLCAQLGRRLDDACPIADASSVEGVRIHAVIAPVVPQGAAISIRFPGHDRYDLRRLCERGLFPVSWMGTLRGLVRRRANILIAGGTGVGKTTLLKALLGECGPAERIISVEEVRELGELGRGDHVSLMAREANVEGAGAVGLTELVKATLRMRPDRIILGECRGAEIADLLRALNSGHRGGMVTLHADGVERVPPRLIALGLLAGLEPAVLAMLAQDAFDAVLHLERSKQGRYIAQIGDFHAAQGAFAGRTLTRWNGREAPSSTPQWERFSAQWAVGSSEAFGSPA